MVCALKRFQKMPKRRPDEENSLYSDCAKPRNDPSQPVLFMLPLSLILLFSYLSLILSPSSPSQQ
jgi:hypothetical protein